MLSHTIIVALVVFNTLSEAIAYAKQRNSENNGVNDYTKYKLVIN